MEDANQVGTYFNESSHGAKTFAYYWDLTNIQHYKSGIGTMLSTPIFNTGTFEWKLNCYLAGYDFESKDYIGLTIDLLNGFKYKNFKITAVLSVISSDGFTYKEKERVLLTKESIREKANIWKKFIGRTDAMGLHEGELGLFCQLKFDDSMDPYRRVSYEDIKINCNSHILKNIGSHLDTGDFSDVKLKVGEYEFPAHKIVLASHSPVFKAMFTIEMREKNEGIVDVEDLEPDVVREMLRLMYFGRSDKLDVLVDKLLVAAEKYQIEALKQTCEDILIHRLSVDNVHEMLHLADRYNAMQLKEQAVSLVINHSSELCTRKDFMTSIEGLSKKLLVELLRITWTTF